MDDTWERRVEAERTEVEPERNPRVWSSWDAGPVCEWMLGQLTQADGPAVPPAGEPAGEPVPVPAAPPPAAGRAQLHIDSAAIIDAAGRTW